MKYIPFFFILLGHLATAHAQSGYYNQAEKLFREKNYDEAAQYYEKFLSVLKRGGARGLPFAVEKKRKGANNINPRQQAVYHLAECYWEERNYAKAEQRFKECTSYPKLAYPETEYWYGVSLRANGKYAEAEEALTSFESNYTEMGPVLMNADRELESLRYIREQLARANSRSFRVTRQSKNGNTSAYALTVQKDDTVVFTSIHSSATSFKSTDPVYKNDLYSSVQAMQVSSGNTAAFSDAAQTTTESSDTTQVSSDTSLLAGSELMTLPQPPADRNEKGVQQGLACFSADGKKMFFTRWTKNAGITHAAIWRSDRSDSGWSTPVVLVSPVNVEGYNSTQPFLTIDDQHLLFSSDRPGGQGKYDLWVANLDTDFQPVYVTNMGEIVNTPGDEESPYYHQNSRTLVFASNGRVGMGGFDIYYTKGEFSFSRWEKPKNPGTPINSTKDDLYFVSTDEDNLWNTGWLSSDRQNDCCLALYTVLQDNTQYVSGSVVDCNSHQPLPGVQLTVTDPRRPGRPLTHNATDSLGHYAFTLKNTSRFRISATTNGYIPDSANFTVQMETGKDHVKNEPICLHAIPVTPLEDIVKDELQSLTKASAVLGNFLYKQATLPASAYANLDSLIVLMHKYPTVIIAVEGYTDGIGGVAYNLRLAQDRVDACIRYLVKKGIASSRLRGKSFGKCCPIAPDTIDGKDNPAGRDKNRRVEYKLVTK